MKLAAKLIICALFFAISAGAAVHMGRERLGSAAYVGTNTFALASITNNLGGDIAWSPSYGGLEVGDVPVSADGYLSRWESASDAVATAFYNGATTTNLADDVGPLYTRTGVGGWAWSTDGRFDSSALQYGASSMTADDGYARIGIVDPSAFGAIDQNESFDVSFWGWVTDNSKNYYIDFFRLYADDGTAICTVREEADNNVVTITARGSALTDYIVHSVADDSWHYYRISYCADDAIFRFYLDGYLIGSTAATGDFTIGTRTTYGETLGLLYAVQNVTYSDTVRMDDFVISVGEATAGSTHSVPTEAYSLETSPSTIVASTLLESALEEAIDLATNSVQNSASGDDITVLSLTGDVMLDGATLHLNSSGGYIGCNYATFTDVLDIEPLFGPRLSECATTNELKDGLSWNTTSGGFRVADVPATKDNAVSYWTVPSAFGTATFVEHFNSDGFENAVSGEACDSEGTATTTSGKFGTALNLSNADGPKYRYRDSWGQMDSDHDFNVSCWLYINIYTQEGPECMVLYDSSGTKILRIEGTISDQIWLRTSADNSEYVTVTTAAWHHVLVSYCAADASFRLFVDGTLRDTLGSVPAFSFVDEGSYTGTSYLWAYDYNGCLYWKMDELVIDTGEAVIDTFSIPTAELGNAPSPYITASTLTESNLVSAVALANTSVQNEDPNLDEVIISKDVYLSGAIYLQPSDNILHLTDTTISGVYDITFDLGGDTVSLATLLGSGLSYTHTIYGTEAGGTGIVTNEMEYTYGVLTGITTNGVELIVEP